MNIHIPKSTKSDKEFFIQFNMWTFMYFHFSEDLKYRICSDLGMKCDFAVYFFFCIRHYKIQLHSFNLMKKNVSRRHSYLMLTLICNSNLSQCTFILKQNSNNVANLSHDTLLRK